MPLNVFVSNGGGPLIDLGTFDGGAFSLGAAS
jgi:hypothetical protein